MISCKQEHFLPPDIFFTRILVSETGDYPRVRKHIYPVQCNHCKSAPCVDACPSGATTKREDGIVIVRAEQCAGCSYCVIACPYQQRTYYGDKRKKGYFPGQGLTELELLGMKLQPLEAGTVVKCNFCAEKIDEGIKRGLRPGVDREATPACVTNCPSKARHFGNLDDVGSNISIIIQQRKGFVTHPELGTEPSLYYVY
jgi:molybdopterin-containing oxidoreductase family iron-sulfur binding subunit